MAQVALIFKRMRLALAFSLFFLTDPAFAIKARTSRIAVIRNDAPIICELARTWGGRFELWLEGITRFEILPTKESGSRDVRAIWKDGHHLDLLDACQPRSDGRLVCLIEIKNWRLFITNTVSFPLAVGVETDDVRPNEVVRRRQIQVFRTSYLCEIQYEAISSQSTAALPRPTAEVDPGILRGI